jgi:small redox-active disulfide protein 2
MKLIQVLGPGCAKCEKLKHNAEDAVRQSGIQASVEKITDINEITSFGVMMTPALAIDGQVKSVGKVLSVEDIRALMT